MKSHVTLRVKASAQKVNCRALINKSYFSLWCAPGVGPWTLNAELNNVHKYKKITFFNFSSSSKKNAFCSTNKYFRL